MTDLEAVNTIYEEGLRGIAYERAKLAKVKETLEDHAKDPVSTLVAIRELLEEE